MCSELLPPGGYPVAVKYIIVYHNHIVSYHIKCGHLKYLVHSAPTENEETLHQGKFVLSTADGTQNRPTVCEMCEGRHGSRV
jgi:hypothetical protein